MTDHIDRAAEVLAITQKFKQMIGYGSIGDEKKIARWLVETFDAAGLLVTPEHDRAVAAKALRDAAEDTRLRRYGHAGISVTSLLLRADRIEAGEHGG